MPDKNEKSFKESEEELIDELAKQRKQRKQRKLGEINGKIMKHRIIEKLNIREIEPEILDETKVYGEIKRLRKLKTKIIKKKKFWKKMMSKKD